MSRNAFLTLGLLVLMTLLVALPAAAEPAVAGGRIYFSAIDESNNVDIYSMNPDGSNVVQLTDNPAGDYSPDISPDGRRVVFISDRESDFEIYVMNADGSDQTRLTYDPESATDPAWSPDGRQIAFVSRREGTMEIFTMTADGGNVTNVTQHAEAEFNMSPAWSPDGTRLAFGSRRQEMEEIWLQTLGQPVDEDNPIALTDTDSWSGGWSGYPAWSPDGSRIVYVRFKQMRQEIYVMDANGDNPTPLTDDDFTDRMPDWSPDGTQIVFAGLREGDNKQRLYVMGADGSGLSGPLGAENGGGAPSWGVAPAGRAKLTVRQVVAGTPPAASWHFSGPLGAFALPAGGGSRSLIYLDPQTTTVSQVAVPGYTTTVSCSNGATGGTSVTVTLANNAPVTCTFTSTFQAPARLIYLPSVRKP